MGIEDAVRDVLISQAEQAPGLRDPANRAVLGARRRHRRRSLLALCAVVVVTSAAAGGSALLHRDRQHAPGPATTVTGTPSPAASLPVTAWRETGIALVNRLELVTPAGTVALTAIPGGAVGARQITGGYLVDGYGGPSGGSASLWSVTADGRLHQLLSGLAAPAVASAGGRRLAWRSGDELKVGHLAATTTVTVDRSSAITTSGVPVALSDSAVVLGRTITGGGIDQFDVWFPERGGYVPSWDAATGITGVYGPAPDGRALLGLVRAGDTGPCLAWLDPGDHLRPARTACGLGIGSPSPAVMSPDGRWLALPTPGRRVVLADLTTVFDQPVAAATWDAPAPGVWLDRRTMLVLDPSGQLLTYRLGTAGPVATAPGPTPDPSPAKGVDTSYRLVAPLS